MSQSVRLDDLPWSAAAVAPSLNEKVGPPIRFGGRFKAVAAEGSDVARLLCVVPLTNAFPVSSGYFIVGSTTKAKLRINGQPVDLVAGQDEPFDVWGHLWAHLVSGDNTLELEVPVGETFEYALQMRDVDANGDATIIDFDSDGWTVSDGAIEKVGDSDDTELFDRPRRSVELCKRVPHDKPIRSASLTLVGPTARDVRLNDKAVTQLALEPGWTDYRKRLTTTTYDVTDLIDAEGDAIAWNMTLGNGWYTSGMGWQHKGRFTSPDTPLWIMGELTLEHDDGTTTRHVTDTSWQWRRSSIVFDSIYDGEHREPVADEAAWQSVVSVDINGDTLVGKTMAPPIAHIETLAVQHAEAKGDGRFILDFGQNHTGVCSVTLTNVPSGSKLRLRHAELLTDDGELNVIYLRTARAADRLTTSGESTWTPGMTYHGYRFAELDGLPSGWTADDVKQRVVSLVLHSDVKKIGTFSTSNSLLNKINDAVSWGIRSNLHSTITDCPQRDERLGWTGDAQIIADTAPWYFDMHGMYRKYLLDLIDAQHDDGGVPHVAPQTVVDEVSMAWADVIAVLPWTLWQQYGDREAMEVAYPSVKKWLDYLERHEVDGRCDVETFGDWVPVVETPTKLVAQAWSVQAAQLAQKIATALGHDADAKTYAAAAKRRASYFHDKYFNAADGRYEPNTQTAQVLPLAFGIVPAEQVEAVAKALATNVREHDGRLTVGFCGAPLLCHVLSENGYDDLAYGIVSTDQKPSLGYMIKAGGTTIWERWDSDTSPPDMNSRNHFAFGSMSRWFYEHLAGVTMQRGNDGRLAITLRPRPFGDLEHVEISRDMPEGTLRVRWEREGNAFRVHGDVPADMNVTLELPSGSNGVEVDGGEAADGMWQLTKPAFAATATLME